MFTCVSSAIPKNCKDNMLCYVCYVVFFVAKFMRNIQNDISPDKYVALCSQDTKYFFSFFKNNHHRNIVTISMRTR